MTQLPSPRRKNTSVEIDRDQDIVEGIDEGCSQRGGEGSAFLYFACTYLLPGLLMINEKEYNPGQVHQPASPTVTALCQPISMHINI